MRKTLIIVPCIGAAVLLALLFNSDPAQERARISIDGTTIYYEGAINQNSYDDFKGMIMENSGVSRLVINSPGGDTKAGILIGKEVHALSLDVTVRDVCFSSCANYIFTAGNLKEIEEGGFVGWHGSEAQFEVMAKSMGITEEELIRQSIMDSLGFFAFLYTEENIQKLYEDIIYGKESEAVFFEMIGVDRKITLDGLSYIEDGPCVGWTYDIDMMESYGVYDVEYLSDESYPDENAISKYDVCAF